MMEKLVVQIVLFFVLLNVVQCANCKKAKAKEIVLNNADAFSDDFSEWLYVPQCQRRNKKLWNPQQCKENRFNGMKRCACVREDGEETTRFTGDLNDKNICTSTKCDMASRRLDYVYEKMVSDGIAVDSFHFPICQARNRAKWEKRQCISGDAQECWTVNTKTGEALD